VLPYAVMLDLILPQHGMAGAETDLATAPVRLGGSAKPSGCDRASLPPHLDVLLCKDLSRILTAQRAHVDWHP
jgi:hypothetical protein